MRASPVALNSAQSEVERACDSNGVGAAVRAAFADLNAAFVKADMTPSGAPVAHFSIAADGAVTLRLGFPAVSEAAAALSAAGLLIGETFGAGPLRGVYSGDYGRLRDAYDAMRAEMAALGVTSTDDSWERYIGGSAADPQQPRIEVLMPVRAA